MLNLKQLSKDYNVSQIHLGEIMGVSQSAVSLMMRGTQKIKYEHIEALIDKFGKETIDAYTVPDTPRRLRTQRTEAEVTIFQPDEVEEVKAEVAEEITECNAVIPYINKELVQRRDADIRAIVLNDSEELEHKKVHSFFSNVNYIQKVITAAMMPLFQPGDLLFVKFLPDNAKLISGAIYLLDTKTYGAMVRQVYVDGDTFRLHSMNPEFEELIVKRSEVFSISLVDKMLRSDFNMPSEIPDYIQMFQAKEKQTDELINELRKQNERMEAERARQDKLIEKLLDR